MQTLVSGSVKLRYLFCFLFLNQFRFNGFLVDFKEIYERSGKENLFFQKDQNRHLMI